MVTNTAESNPGHDQRNGTYDLLRIN